VYDDDDTDDDDTEDVDVYSSSVTSDDTTAVSAVVIMADAAADGVADASALQCPVAATPSLLTTPLLPSADDLFVGLRSLATSSSSSSSLSSSSYASPSPALSVPFDHRVNAATPPSALPFDRFGEMSSSTQSTSHSSSLQFPASSAASASASAAASSSAMHLELYDGSDDDDDDDADDVDAGGVNDVDRDVMFAVQALVSAVATADVDVGASASFSNLLSSSASRARVTTTMTTPQSLHRGVFTSVIAAAGAAVAAADVAIGRHCSPSLMTRASATSLTSRRSSPGTASAVMQHMNVNNVVTTGVREAGRRVVRHDPVAAHHRRQRAWQRDAARRR
jgi:hypothetical protein